jgi:hypothetical protein
MIKKSLLLLLAVTCPYVLAEIEPHWINSGLNNRDLTISPDGTLLFSTIMAPANQFSAIIMSRKVNGNWQEPTLAPFSGQYADIEPMFSPDGERLYFASKRPRTEGDDRTDWDIWYVERDGIGWGDPVNTGEPINTEANEFYPSIASSGNLYFTVEREEGMGREDLFRAVMEEGKWSRIENLGPGVNSKTWEFNAFVEPDEKWILFSSQGREGEVGGGDLYASFMQPDGIFGDAVLLSSINSPQLDYCPSVYDGILYFTSRKFTHADSFMRLQDLVGAFTNAGNGFGDIYEIPLTDLIEFNRTVTEE